MIRVHVLALAAGTLIGAAPALAGDAARGKQTFMRVGCYECHGTVGQGGSTGPKLAPDPLPLDAMVQFVRNSSRAMPPYSPVILSDEDLADIQAYLESLPKPPDPNSLPLLAP